MYFFSPFFASQTADTLPAAFFFCMNTGIKNPAVPLFITQQIPQELPRIWQEFAFPY